MAKNHYETLGVPERADAATIKRAYRRLARKLHPDVNKASDSAAKMRDVNEAYGVLADFESRAGYDASRRTSLPEEEAPKREANGFAAAEHRLTLVDLPSPVYCVRFSQDSRQLAACTFDNVIRYFSARTGKSLGETPLEGGSVSVLEWAGGGALRAAGSGDKTVSFWELRGRDVAHNAVKRIRWVSQIALHYKEPIAVLGSVHRSVVWADTRSGKLIHQRERHEDAVTAVAISRDGRLVATGSNDQRVILWDMATALELAILEPFRSPVAGISFSPDGSLLAVALVDSGIRVLELSTGVTRATLWGPKKPNEDLAFHPCGWMLAAAARDGNVRLWNTTSGQAAGILGGHEAAVKTLAFSPDGRLLAAGSLARLITIWNVRTLQGDS